MPKGSKLGSQSLSTGQRASRQGASAPGTVRRTLSELRRELDFLNTDKKRQRLGQSPATGQCARDQRAPAAVEAHRALFSELRCELDNLDTSSTRQRLGQSLSGSASTARAAPQAAPDVYTSLPTAFSWDRNNAQTGGLLDWAMDELHDYWHQEVRSAEGQRVRALRGRLTCDQAVVIFVARRYVPHASFFQTLTC